MAPAGTGSADLVDVLRYYVDKMLRDVPGMKVLLLDAETTRVLSTVFSQSEILEQEVYLVERLDADKGDQLLHLKVMQVGVLCSPSRRLPPPLTTEFAMACRLCASCAPHEKTLRDCGVSCGIQGLASTTCVSLHASLPAAWCRSTLRGLLIPHA